MREGPAVAGHLLKRQLDFLSHFWALLHSQALQGSSCMYRKAGFSGGLLRPSFYCVPHLSKGMLPSFLNTDRHAHPSVSIKYTLTHGLQG